MRNTAKLTTFSIILIASVLLIPFCAFAWLVPDSGQTKCYSDTAEITCPAPGNNFYGQDAQYTINPPSYTKLDAGGNGLSDDATEWVMVRDNITGLIWEVKQAKDDVADYDNPHDSDNTYTWYDSNPATNGGDAGTQGDGTDTEDFINALNDESFGGYSDWRLPTIKDLGSLANLGTRYPAIATEYFPNTQCHPNNHSGRYWSLIPRANTIFASWVGFAYGRCYYGSKSLSYYVRGVRSDGSSDPLVINGDGTVTDTETGLMWQQGSDSDMNWKEALAYCESLELGGHNDWRLPSREELRSIVDYEKYDPAIDTEYFLNTDSWDYWSATTYASPGVTDYAWCVKFSYGLDYYDPKSYSRYVRGVRSIGQLGHLVISADPTSRGTVTGTGISCPGDCVQSYGSGTAVQFTATPADCYEFTSWSGDCSGTNPTCTLTVSDEKSAIANFAVKTFTLTVTKEGNGTGTLSESTQMVNCGDNLTVTATPDGCSEFAGWSGDATGTSNAVLTNIQSDKTLTATFNQSQETFTVTINTAGNGSGTLSQSTQSVSCGSNLTVTATPDAYSTFAGWTGDASGTGNAVLTNITSNKTITATFNPNVTMTTNNAGNGTVTGTGISCPGDCTESYNFGTPVQLTATPADCHKFTGWSGNCSGTSPICTLTMDNDKSATANFAIKNLHRDN